MVEPVFAQIKTNLRGGSTSGGDGSRTGHRTFYPELGVADSRHRGSLRRNGHPRVRVLRPARLSPAVRADALRKALTVHASLWRFRGDPDELLRRYEALLTDVPAE